MVVWESVPTSESGKPIHSPSRSNSLQTALPGIRVNLMTCRFRAAPRCKETAGHLLSPFQKHITLMVTFHFPAARFLQTHRHRRNDRPCKWSITYQPAITGSLSTYIAAKAFNGASPRVDNGEHAGSPASGHEAGPPGQFTIRHGHF